MQSENPDRIADRYFLPLEQRNIRESEMVPIVPKKSMRGRFKRTHLRADSIGSVLAAEIQAHSVLTTGKKKPGRELALESGVARFATGGASKSVVYVKTQEQIVADMKEFRQKVIEALLEKDFTLVPVDKLSNALKNVNHDIQLLTGGKTENVQIDEDRRIIKGILLDIRHGKTNDNEGTVESNAALGEGTDEDADTAKAVPN